MIETMEMRKDHQYLAHKCSRTTLWMRWIGGIALVVVVYFVITIGLRW